MKNKKNLTIAGVILAVLVIGGLTVLTNPTTNSEAPTASDSSGITITKEDITKTATVYPYESNGTYMEVIAIRANDGTVRTALNTCQVCYNSGRGYYEQLGEALICKNCGNQFTVDQIELVKGGCNPVPITSDMKTEDETTIVIDTESLVEYEPLFKNWKR